MRRPLTLRLLAPDGENEGGDEEQSFVLRLLQEGDTVTGTVSEEAVRKGSFRDGVLEIEVADGEEVYSLRGDVAGSKVSGQWSAASPGGKKGTVSGQKDEAEGGWALSPAVVPLYEYRSGDGGPRFYSTDPEEKEPGLLRSPRAVCRVWKNPLKVLILDRDARPGPWPDG